ncbi:MAG: LptE family protein [Chitinophagales bacterium]
MVHFIKYTAIVVFSLVWQSCGVYSFTGASISPEIKSVTVNTFENRSQNGSVELSQLLTNELKDKFIRETDLRMVDFNGDIEFTGTIVNYQLSGQAPTGDQTTAAQRLTIGVSVEYFNNKEEGKGYKTTFSRFAEFDDSQSFENVKDELYNDIFEQLAIEIFNKALVNW